MSKKISPCKNKGLFRYLAEAVSLAEAREKARELKLQIRNGIDPLEQKQKQ